MEAGWLVCVDTAMQAGQSRAGMRFAETASGFPALRAFAGLTGLAGLSHRVSRGRPDGRFSWALPGDDSTRSGEESKNAQHSGHSARAAAGRRPRDDTLTWRAVDELAGLGREQMTQRDPAISIFHAPSRVEHKSSPSQPDPGACEAAPVAWDERGDWGNSNR